MDAALMADAPDGCAGAHEPRVLIVRLGAMGDVIHALPAVAMLRRALPEARIEWAIEERWRELLCAPGVGLAGARGVNRPADRPLGRPLVDEVIPVDTRRWRRRPFSSAVRREFLATVGTLRSRKYAVALDFQGAIKSAVLARLSRPRLVAGFRNPREALARCFYGRQVDSGAAHVIEQNWELAQSWLRESGLGPEANDRGGISAASGLGIDAAGSCGDALLPRHESSEAQIAAVLQPLGLTRAGFAILNPGAGWAAKQWSPSRYGKLAIALAQRGLRSVVNYGPGEESLAAEVASASQGAAAPLATTLTEFIALARRADLFVGGDTGPMHLAALLGVKTLALFGPTDPARNGPYWKNSRVVRDPASVPSYSHSRGADPGLERLSVERVLAEVDGLLKS